MNFEFEVPDVNVSHLSSPSTSGSVSSGDLPAVCQSEAVLPQPLAHFPQQLPLKPQGQSFCLYHANARTTVVGVICIDHKQRYTRTQKLCSLCNKFPPMGNNFDKTTSSTCTQHWTSHNKLLHYHYLIPLQLSNQPLVCIALRETLQVKNTVIDGGS